MPYWTADETAMADNASVECECDECGEIVPRSGADEDMECPHADCEGTLEPIYD